jgi:hypothetical protein
VARDIVSRDPNYQLSEEMLAGSFGITQQTVNNWIRDIRVRQKASRDSRILRLNRLGWTQQKIAQVVGISQARVSEIIGNANFCIIDNLIAQGREMPYIAGHLNMDLATAWAIKLTGLKDQEKFKALGWGLRTWDQWYFNDCDDRFGTDWPGRIPAQLVAHTLLYFHRLSAEHRLQHHLRTRRLAGCLQQGRPGGRVRHHPADPGRLKAIDEDITISYTLGIHWRIQNIELLKQIDEAYEDAPEPEPVVTRMHPTHYQMVKDQW